MGGTEVKGRDMHESAITVSWSFRVDQRSPCYLKEKARPQEMTITVITKGYSLTNMDNCSHLEALYVLQDSAVPGTQGDCSLMGGENSWRKEKTITKPLGV